MNLKERWLMSIYTKIVVICLTVSTLISCVTSEKTASQKNNQSTENEQRVLDSEELILEFMTMLKMDLKKSLKQHSPENAINACNQSAPFIAETINEKYGWKIGRTSLKLRNQSNKPDAWEARVMKSFSERRADGEAIQDLSHFEIITENGVKNFRYMKAIPTMTVCLKCHGENVSEAVKARLKKVYPDDKAVNFKFGDIRGAFTVTQKVE